MNSDVCKSNAFVWFVGRLFYGLGSAGGSVGFLLVVVIRQFAAEV